MDMYQKRKARQEKVNSQTNEQKQNQMNINWYVGSYEKTLSNP